MRWEWADGGEVATSLGVALGASSASKVRICQVGALFCSFIVAGILRASPQGEWTRRQSDPKRQRDDRAGLLAEDARLFGEFTAGDSNNARPSDENQVRRRSSNSYTIFIPNAG